MSLSSAYLLYHPRLRASPDCGYRVFEEPVNKRRRYNDEPDPDLEVVVEDEVFRVNSYDLMAASHVFASMLEKAMCESMDGRIVLEGKSNEEFQTLLEYISVRRSCAAPRITRDNIEFLLKWSYEYEMTGLAAQCVQYIKDEASGEDIVGIISRMGLEFQYKLKDLLEVAEKKLAADLYTYQNEIVQLADTPAIMCTTLPDAYVQRIGASAELVDGWRGSEMHFAFGDERMECI